MQALLIILQLIVCITLVALILLQQGKGAEIGAAFGSGASNTLFGSPGASTFLFKATAWIAALFFVSSLALSYYDNLRAKQSQTLQIPAAIIQQQAQQAILQKAIQPAQVDKIPTQSAPVVTLPTPVQKSHNTPATSHQP